MMVVLPSIFFQKLDMSFSSGKYIKFLVVMGMPVIKDLLSLKQLSSLVLAKVRELKIIDTAYQLRSNFDFPRVFNEKVIGLMVDFDKLSFPEIKTEDLDFSECDLKESVDFSKVSRNVRSIYFDPQIIRIYSKAFNLKPQEVLGKAVYCYFKLDKSLKLFETYKVALSVYDIVYTYTAMKEIYSTKFNVPAFQKVLEKYKSYFEEKKEIDTSKSDFLDWVISL